MDPGSHRDAMQPWGPTWAAPRPVPLVGRPHAPDPRLARAPQGCRMEGREDTGLPRLGAPGSEWPGSEVPTRVAGVASGQACTSQKPEHVFSCGRCPRAYERGHRAHRALSRLSSLRTSSPPRGHSAAPSASPGVQELSPGSRSPHSGMVVLGCQGTPQGGSGTPCPHGGALGQPWDGGGGLVLGDRALEGRCHRAAPSPLHTLPTAEQLGGYL